MVYRGFMLKTRGLRRSVYQSDTRAVPVEKGDGPGMMVTGWRLFCYKLCCCSTPTTAVVLRLATTSITVLHPEGCRPGSGQGGHCLRRGIPTLLIMLVQGFELTIVEGL